MRFIELEDTDIVREEECKSFLCHVASDICKTGSQITKRQFQVALAEKIVEHFPVLKSIMIENQTKPVQQHAEASLPPALNNFKLLESCVAKINGKGMRAIELAIQNNPSDMNGQQELRDRTDKMALLYAEEIQKRLEEPGLTKLVAKLCQEGNDSFRKVYDTVWDETIANSEQTAIEKYVQLMDKMKEVVHNTSVYKQPTSSLVELYVYVQAAVTKRKFDDLALEIKKEEVRRVQNRRPKRFKRKIMIRAFNPRLREGSRILREPVQGSCGDAIILDVLQHLLATS